MQPQDGIDRARAGLGEVTAAQQAMWSRGDFHRIGVSQLVVGELLVRALHVRAGERVLDVAAGAGNTALAAARRAARATCTDYVPDLLEHARVRAAAEGLTLELQTADAQALPFPDGTFDVVTSTFGAMFAPDQQATADELLRVLRPGGRLGMANWTPQSWVGAQFAVQARFAPPPPGVGRPMAWGTPERLTELFGDRIDALVLTTDHMDFVATDTEELWQTFATWFGPVVTILARLDDAGRAAFREAWIAAADAHNIADDGSCEIPSDYLQVVAVKR